jgi:hypothetical protein
MATSSFLKFRFTSRDRRPGPAQMSWKVSWNIAQESGTMSELNSTVSLEPTTLHYA